MTMDLTGNAPTSEAGKWFGANNSGWSVIGRFAEEVAPEITAKIESLYLNDGDGLEDEDAKALADRIQAAIDDGRASAYASTEFGSTQRLLDWFDAKIREFVVFLRDCGGFEIW